MQNLHSNRQLFRESRFTPEQADRAAVGIFAARFGFRFLPEVNAFLRVVPTQKDSILFDIIPFSLVRTKEGVAGPGKGFSPHIEWWGNQEILEGLKSCDALKGRSFSKRTKIYVDDYLREINNDR